MGLDAVREVIIADAEEEAERIVSAAREEAERRLEEARNKAELDVEAARSAAMVEADTRLAMERAAVRREARRAELEARARIRRSLVESAVKAVSDRRGSREYQVLLDRLELQVQAQLGQGAETTRDPPEGGVIGQCGNRRLDYTIQAVVERVVDAMGPEIEELWN